MEFFQAANKFLEDILLFNKLKEIGISPGNFLRGLTKFTILYVLRYGIGMDQYPLDYIK